MSDEITLCIELDFGIDEDIYLTLKEVANQRTDGDIKELVSTAIEEWIQIQLDKPFVKEDIKKLLNL